ncbi:MAG: N-acetylmuramoyl-L-alanine amidase [Alphaproteobacteria bacterium]|nr:MAG: N-acetylmuramoyl-L-alanine amidase [Alphaproteobacteria bacterium]
MIVQPSPNFDDRPPEGRIKYLILHYTGMTTEETALKRLCDAGSKVSAHYMIAEDGRVFSLVAEDRRAWHAGVAAWEGDTDINGLSIGVEMVNPGHDGPNYCGNYRPFPPAQMAALVELSRDILSRHRIAPWHVLGHSDVAPARKSDPGELFDWQGLASEGVGLWPEMSGDKPADAASFQQKLADYGYKIEITGTLNSQTHAVVRAFQRHFRPADMSGTFDRQCHSILDVLLDTRKDY